MDTLVWDDSRDSCDSDSCVGMGVAYMNQSSVPTNRKLHYDKMSSLNNGQHSFLVP